MMCCHDIVIGAIIKPVAQEVKKTSGIGAALAAKQAEKVSSLT